MHKTKIKLLIFLANFLILGIFCFTPSVSMARSIDCGQDNCTGLAGYWTMDDLSAPILDLSGNGNDATQVGTLTYAQTEKVVGTSILFPGGNAWGNAGSDASLMLGTGAGKQWTVSLWWYSTSGAGQHTAIGKGALGSENQDYTFFQTGGFIYWATGSAGDSCASMGRPQPSLNAWHHIVGTLDQTGATSGTKKLYIDGALIDTCPYTAKASSSSAALQLGDGSGGGYGWVGYLDEISVWSRELPLADIEKLYGLPGLPEGPAGGCVPGSLDPNQQCGEITIACDSATTDVSMTLTPSDTTFVGKSVTIGTPIQSSVSTLATNDALAGFLDYSTHLQVIGNAIEDCENTMTSWSIKAVSTDLTTTTSDNIIPKENIHAMVSKLVESDTPGAILTCDDNSVFCSNAHVLGPVTTYNLQAGNCMGSTPGNWNDASTYNCALSTNQTLMSFTHTPDADQGFNATADVGVTLAIKDGIAIDQAPGTYSGTITYTFSETL